MKAKKLRKRLDSKRKIILNEKEKKLDEETEKLTDNRSRSGSICECL